MHELCVLDHDTGLQRYAHTCSLSSGQMCQLLGADLDSDMLDPQRGKQYERVSQMTSGPTD